MDLSQYAMVEGNPKYISKQSKENVRFIRVPMIYGHLLAGIIQDYSSRKAIVA